MSLHRTLAVATLASLSPFFVGCIGAEARSGPEETAERGDAVTVATYYTARRDARECASPECGGYFISAVNQDKTLCADGILADECYVSDFQYASLLLTSGSEGRVVDAIGWRHESTRAVLLGDLVEGQTGQPGTLFVRFAWIADKTAEIDGSYFRAWFNGIYCIAAPCPSFDQEFLNTGAVRSFHGVELKEVPGADESDYQGNTALFSSLGLIVAGKNVRVENAGPAGPGVFLEARQAFIPILLDKLRRSTNLGTLALP